MNLGRCLTIPALIVCAVGLVAFLARLQALGYVGTPGAAVVMAPSRAADGRARERPR